MKLELKTTSKDYRHAKFDVNPTTCVVWANTQFANSVRFICLSFLVSSSRAQVPPASDFDNILPCKDLPFGGFVDITAHLGVQRPPKNKNGRE